ncbi:glycosyltransferase family 9 protein [Melioribacteraceae bacterium 4301-Me]|uniref:glycosyltransferase family 9 protein n=1 Tax=Pyranulibacter aquaticus TaxID=3163344 RepID=UPI00359C0EC5
MPIKKIFQRILTNFIKRFFSVAELNTKNLGHPQKILLIRQHNQFGDMLASVPLFRAIKEKFPNSNLTLIASPENYYAVTKNNFIDELFIFDKRKIINPLYLLKLKKTLKANYDLAVVPATVAISKTSCILAALSDAKIKIGPSSLNGKVNELSSLFNFKIKLNWQKYPDIHVSDFIQDILRPFGISTKNLKTQITIEKDDLKTAEDFIETLKGNTNHEVVNSHKLVVGLHIGAGKRLNRWSIEKFLQLTNLLSVAYEVVFYFTGSKSDKEELNYVKKIFGENTAFFIDHSIPELAALISLSDLFITNDTGVMHVAGATDTPQISIFGPTNPYNWAPMGPNKYFVRKSDLTDDVTVEDVFLLCKLILEKKTSEKNKSNLI